ncbi:MAG: OadG family protein [Rikenellaceae bacterium]
MNQLIMTPLFTMLNTHSSGPKGADTILESDPYGLTVAFISVSVVLSALIILGLLIWSFSKVMIYMAKRQSEIARKKSLKNPKAVVHDEDADDSGEVIAAIALALKLNKEALHDKESEVITINRVARSYSPWSSKIYGLTRKPR